MIGFHFQKPIDGWVDAAVRLPSGTPIKFIDNVQALSEIKNLRPDLRTVLRHHYDGRQDFGGDYEHRKAVSREFFATFIDGTFDNYAHNVDYVEGWNEYNAVSHTQAEIDDRVLHDQAMADVWLNEYRTQGKYSHIQLVIPNAAIGNDIPLRTAQACRDYDAVLGYHAYIHFINGEIDVFDWQYHSGRFVNMDAAYLKAGIEVQWLFTEGGPYKGVTEGWRHADVCANDLGRYLDALVYWLDNVTAWNKANGNRALGVTLFNSGMTSSQWADYETSAVEMHAIADMLAEYEPAPPIDPPDPGDDWQQVAWDSSLEKQCISLNDGAAIQNVILDDGFIVVSTEWWEEIELITYAFQVGEKRGTNERRVYYAVVPNWHEVDMFTDPKVSG